MTRKGSEVQILYRPLSRSHHCRPQPSPRRLAGGGLGVGSSWLRTPARRQLNGRRIRRAVTGIAIGTARSGLATGFGSAASRARELDVLADAVGLRVRAEVHDRPGHPGQRGVLRRVPPQRARGISRELPHAGGGRRWIRDPHPLHRHHLQGARRRDAGADARRHQGHDVPRRIRWHRSARRLVLLLPRDARRGVRRPARQRWPRCGPDARAEHENAPIEETELNYPVRIVRYELVEDSEGAGRHRGGLGRAATGCSPRARPRSPCSPIAIAAVHTVSTGGAVAQSISVGNTQIAINFTAAEGRVVRFAILNASISIPPFFELTGDFTVQTEGDMTLYGARNVELFLGSLPIGQELRDANGVLNPDAIGLLVTNARLGLVKWATAPGAAARYAVYAYGEASFVGLDGLTISGSVTVRLNSSGLALDKSIILPSDPLATVPIASNGQDDDGDGLIDEAGEQAAIRVKFNSAAKIEEFSAGFNELGELDPDTALTISAAGIDHLRAVSFTRMPNGQVNVDMPQASVDILDPDRWQPAAGVRHLGRRALQLRRPGRLPAGGPARQRLLDLRRGRDHRRAGRVAARADRAYPRALRAVAAVSRKVPAPTSRARRSAPSLEAPPPRPRDSQRRGMHSRARRAGSLSRSTAARPPRLPRARATAAYRGARGRAPGPTVACRRAAAAGPRSGFVAHVERDALERRARAGCDLGADAERIEQREVARRDAFAAHLAARERVLLDQRDRPAGARQQDRRASTRPAPAPTTIASNRVAHGGAGRRARSRWVNRPRRTRRSASRSRCAPDQAAPARRRESRRARSDTASWRVTALRRGSRTGGCPRARSGAPRLAGDERVGARRDAAEQAREPRRRRSDAGTDSRRRRPSARPRLRRAQSSTSATTASPASRARG